MKDLKKRRMILEIVIAALMLASVVAICIYFDQEAKEAAASDDMLAMCLAPFVYFIVQIVVIPIMLILETAFFSGVYFFCCGKQREHRLLRIFHAVLIGSSMLSVLSIAVGELPFINETAAGIMGNVAVAAFCVTVLLGVVTLVIRLMIAIKRKKTAELPILTSNHE